MKIGMLSRFPPEKDGIGIYTEELVQALRKKVKVIKIGSLHSDADYCLDMKSSLLHEKLKHIIKKEQLDLLHIQYIAPFYSKMLNYNLLKALKQAIPVIVTLHEVQYHTETIKQMALAKIEGLVVKRASRVIVHTERQKAFLEKKYAVKNVKNILMGFNMEEMSRKGKNLLFFGMISREKGIPYLLKAMSLLKGFHLTVKGNPISNQIGEEIHNELRRCEEVDYELGWIPDKEKQASFRKANIVVLPYTWGPYQSAVIANAMEYGLPVVVSKVGAIWELVEENGLGEVVSPRNPKQIADAIKEVYINYPSYLKTIAAFRKKANWSQSAEKHYQIYKNVTS
ncbi:glycosyltransferase family 4 protein [Candidatus Woesearchaeota archaeon]|nr:glycosyltransferase family 4 protein [Candidatus Woesearchaeota archaeon]